MIVQPPEVAFFYTPAYQAFDYGPTHPFKISRLARTVEMIQACGLLDRPHIRSLEGREAPEPDLRRIHHTEYLDVLRAANNGTELPSPWVFGLGTSDNPIFPGLYDWSRLVAGASLEAARLIATGTVSRAFSIAGGMHHAMARRAAGFCYLNDAAVAIAWLVAQGLRVAYVDIDAHHGDGVQAVFDQSDRVLTISLHETGLTLFPGTGFPEEIGRGRGEGYTVNVPLYPGTDDEIFLWAFEEVVPPLLAAFRPDVLVTQLGVDALKEDPLSHLALSLNAFLKIVGRLKESCPRWLAFGGGGYHLGTVPRGWTGVFALMTEQELPTAIPKRCRPSLEAAGYRETAIIDPPRPTLGKAKEKARRYARGQVARVRQLIFPRWDLAPVEGRMAMGS